MFNGLLIVLLFDVTVDVVVGVGRRVVGDVLLSEDGGTWGPRIEVVIKVDEEGS